MKFFSDVVADFAKRGGVIVIEDNEDGENMSITLERENDDIVDLRAVIVPYRRSQSITPIVQKLIYLIDKNLEGK